MNEHDASAAIPQRHTVTGRQLVRRNVEAAIAKATMPVAFIDCDLESVDLSRLDVSGFSFERCNIIEADLAHMVAIGTTWKGCRARKAMLRGIDLTDARIESGDWNNSDWSTAQLSGLNVTGAKLTGATFKDARSLGISFTDCPMQSSDLTGISFRRMKVGRCDMTRADIRGCDMRQIVFTDGSSLAGALIAETKFQDADLRQVDLSGHGVDALKHLIGARISAHQAAAIVSSAGLKVG